MMREPNPDRFDVDDALFGVEIATKLSDARRERNAAEDEAWRWQCKASGWMVYGLVMTLIAGVGWGRWWWR